MPCLATYQRPLFEPLSLLGLSLKERLVRRRHDLIIEARQPRRVLLYPLVVGELLLHGVAAQVEVCQLSAPAEVVELVEAADAVALEVQHGQVLQEADVEELGDLVETEVQLLQVLEGLDALDLS